MRWIIRLSLSLLLTALLTLLLLWASEWVLGTRIVMQSVQPPEVSYGGVKYRFCAVRIERLFDEDVFLFAGRLPANPDEPPTYGHFFRSPSFPKDESNRDEYLKKMFVAWSDSGITAQTHSGHRLFIPQHLFTQGR